MMIFGSKDQIKAKNGLDVEQLDFARSHTFIRRNETSKMCLMALIVKLKWFKWLKVDSHSFHHSILLNSIDFLTIVPCVLAFQFQSHLVEL